MARTGDSPGPNRRREARYPTRHRVEGEPLGWGERTAFDSVTVDLGGNRIVR